MSEKGNGGATQTALAPLHIVLRVGLIRAVSMFRGPSFMLTWFSLLCSETQRETSFINLSAIDLPSNQNSDSQLQVEASCYFGGLGAGTATGTASLSGRTSTSV